MNLFLGELLQLLIDKFLQNVSVSYMYKLLTYQY